jgi:hypothetical protein
MSWRAFLATFLCGVDEQIRLVERRKGTRELLREALSRAEEEALRAQGLIYG